MQLSSSFSRRGFVTLPVLGGVLSRTGFAAKADDSAGFRLGVATYSFRDFDRAKAIEGIKALRVDTVSVKESHAKIDASPEEWAAARKDFEDAGVKIVSVGNVTFHDDTDAAVDHNFRYAQALGAQGIVMAPTQEVLPRIEKAVKKYNIKAMIHNHGPEDKYFPSPQSVLKAVKGMDPRMGLCIDIGHTVRTGADLLGSIAEAGPRLLDFHVKDLRDLKDKNSQCAVGEGEMPIAAMFRLLRKMNYKGNVNLEYEINAKNPLPGMIESFAYMRGVLAGMNS